MKRFFIIIFFFIVLASLTFRTDAQSIDFMQYNSWAVGVKFGLLPFYGDVRQLNYSTENKYKKTNTAFTFETIKNFSHVFGTRLNVLSGKLTGSSPNLNFHFTTNLLESSLSGIVNINDLVGIYPKKNKIINTYIFAGVGVASFRSRVYSFDENTYITGFGYDSTGLSKTAMRNELVFPLGIGFKFNADEKFDIGLEFTLHLTNTDKLDAWMVENSYNDRYGYAAISFTYKIGSRREYVDWISPFQDTSLANIILARENSIISEQNSDSATAANNINSNQNNSNTGNVAIVELKYFIVSGTYTSKKLAKESTDKLLNKGYPDANYFLQKSSGNWRVYYKGYATIDKALTDWVSIKKINPYAKLLEKKAKETYNDLTSSYKNYTPTVTEDTIKTNTTNNTIANNQSTNTTNTNNNSNTSNNTNTSNNSNTTTNTTNNTTSNNSNNTTNTDNTNTTNNTTTTVVKKFYIIAGSYTTEQLANDGVSELKAKGFPNAEVVGKNDYGSYRIAYKGYATREEAAADLTGIKQSTNPSAWIFEKK